MKGWLQKLRAQANELPAIVRAPFLVQNMKIGSVEPVFMDQFACSVNKFWCGTLLKEERGSWHLLGEQDSVTANLHHLASVLRSTSQAGAWRNEQLAVRDEQGTQLGTIERGAVRSFGIATLAVHLVGQAGDGRFWVQQRAFDKPNDPGKWDTLMGGMVSAGDTVTSALERETWEEAGLQICDLQNIRYGGRKSNCRPSSDGAAGYMQEYIEWYSCTVPDGFVPKNQDGEVAQFALMDEAQLLAAMQHSDFTTEAALIMAGVLGLV